MLQFNVTKKQYDQMQAHDVVMLVKECVKSSEWQDLYMFTVINQQYWYTTVQMKLKKGSAMRDKEQSNGKYH